MSPDAGSLSAGTAVATVGATVDAAHGDADDLESWLSTLWGTAPDPSGPPTPAPNGSVTPTASPAPSPTSGSAPPAQEAGSPPATPTPDPTKASVGAGSSPPPAPGAASPAPAAASLAGAPAGGSQPGSPAQDVPDRLLAGTVPSALAAWTAAQPSGPANMAQAAYKHQQAGTNSGPSGASAMGSRAGISPFDPVSPLVWWGIGLVALAGAATAAFLRMRRI